MKHLRMLAALLLIAAIVTAPAPARAVADNGATADVVEPPAGDTTAPLSKAGVKAAVGCGFAIASTVILPNPVSAFFIGFDCGMMLIDAFESEDR